jgi:hypothetical protein
MLNPRACEQSWSTLLVLELDVADLAATGFAISPLSETVRAVQLLAKRETPAVNAPWVRWARNELGWRPLRLPRLWPLIVNGLPTHPEFQAPALEVRMPELGAELARLCATPAAAVPTSLHRVWEGHPWPESARELAARPRESQADIAYRASLLAGGGARSLFSDLHPDLHWSGGTLTLTDTDQGSSPLKIMLGPNGVVLMASIFNWPLVSPSRATSTQTIMLYPARGAATVWESGALASGREEAAEALLGAPRDRLLTALRSPATTTALARRLGVTPTTALGLALLGAGSALSGASAS